MTNRIQTADEAILAALARIEAKVDAALGRGAERIAAAEPIHVDPYESSEHAAWMRLNFPAQTGSARKPEPQHPEDLPPGTWEPSPIMPQRVINLPAAWKALAKRLRQSNANQRLTIGDYQRMWLSTHKSLQRVIEEIAELKRPAPPQDVTAAVEAERARLHSLAMAYINDNYTAEEYAQEVAPFDELLRTMFDARSIPAQPATGDR